MLQLNLDCLVLIFNELQDKKSFRSCLLVNREWCHLVVPILWKKYSWREMNKSILNIILYFLPSSSKQLLSDNNIELPTTTLLKPPLFNYINFCEFPNSSDVKKIVSMVLPSNDNSNDKRIILEQEIYKLFISQCKNIKRLRWSTSQPLLSFPGASTFFSQLNSLFIDLNFTNSNTLYELAKICKDLNELGISYCYKDLPGLASLIDSQKNLSKVEIYCSSLSYGEVECEEQSNEEQSNEEQNNEEQSNEEQSNEEQSNDEQSKALARKGNTINTLHLTLGTIPPSFLTSLINLTKLSISNVSPDDEEVDEIDIKEFQQYLAISEFPNLQSLEVDRLSCFKELEMLMEKAKGNILRVIIGSFVTGALIEAIANNCPNIEYLDVYLKPNEFIHVKSLLINCEKLIEVKFYDQMNFVYDDCVGDELLDSLTKFSPKSLTYITIRGTFKYSVDAFKQFFGSYGEKSFRYFHINVHNFTKSHGSVVKEYIDERMIEFYPCRGVWCGSVSGGGSVSYISVTVKGLAGPRYGYRAKLRSSSKKIQ